MLQNHPNHFRKTIASLLLLIWLASSACSSFHLSDVANIAQESELQEKAIESIKAKITYKDQDDSYDLKSLNDEKIQEYVSAIADNIAKALHRNRPYIEVVDTPIIQALSKHYIHIIITRGMINMIHSEAELAALIGHEIGHQALHKDSNSRKESNKEELANELASRLIRTDQTRKILHWKDDILQAHWNQAKEQAADEYGAVAASKAGYNPYSFADLFDRLAVKVIDNPLYRLEKVRGTHKALSDRSSHLRKFLAQKGYKKSTGKPGETEYTTSVASLAKAAKKKISKSSCSKNSARQARIIDELDAFSQEIDTLQASKKPLELQRFLSMMKRASEITQTCKLPVPKLFPGPLHSISKGTSKKIQHFMEEKLSQDIPTWDDFGVNPIEQKLHSFLEKIGRIAVGFIPGVNDAVDLYEVVSGRDFISGEKLSTLGRLVSGVGLLAASGSFWREGESLLETTRSLGSEGRSVDEIVSELNRIDKVASEVRPVLGDRYVRELPDLANIDKRFSNAFEGEVSKVTYEPGEVLFQAQRTGQTEPGSWFGPVRPANAEEAQRLYNLKVSENDAAQIKAYVTKERISAYAGKVKGGEGYQAYFPPDVPKDQVLKEVR